MNPQNTQKMGGSPNRNEPCSCGSGKKFKRCCGPPSEETPVRTLDLSVPKPDPSAAMAGMPMGDLPEGMPAAFQNPEFMQQAAQALKSLPRGQMQRLQTLMQKAMSGQNIEADAAELEKALPTNFKNLVQSWQGMAGTDGGSVGESVEALQGASVTPQTMEPEMSVEKARQLVEEAMKDGSIPKAEAEDLLQAADKAPHSSGLGQLWKQLRGKKV